MLPRALGMAKESTQASVYRAAPIRRIRSRAGSAISTAIPISGSGTNADTANGSDPPSLKATLSATTGTTAPVIAAAPGSRGRHPAPRR